MKVSLNWIRKYVDLPNDIDMKDLAHKLTMSCVEVEDAVNLKEGLDKIIAGKILEISPHPNADKLRITRVDVGRDEALQIVCGGSNLYIDQMVVIADLGSYVKWHGEGDLVEIKPAELRGVPSSGMICGASEIGMEELFPVEEDHMIMDISHLNCKPGEPIADILKLDDIILEIDNKSLTNRPDLWGHYGIAREIAAIYKLPLKELPKFNYEASNDFPVIIEAPEKCTRFTATIFEGLRNEESPLDLQVDLWKVGMRPINSIVDITNWVMLAVGQPTHAYDKNHIKENITVRNAHKGEELTLLLGRKLILDEDNLVICDSKDSLGLAGIMGGIKDSVLDDTKDIIFEAASFTPGNIRHTATKYGLRTEASMRFEKGIDQNRVDDALAVANELIKSLYPEAKIVSFTDTRPVLDKKVEVLVTTEFLNTRLGRDLSTEEIIESLKPLGFISHVEKENLKIQVPSWRATGDVDLADDILEEVARMIGYDNFTYSPPRITLEEAINQKEYDIDRAIREYLAIRCGLQEVFTYPWTSIDYIRAAGLDNEEMLKLSSPPSPKEENLRRSLVPGILEVIEGNLRYFDSFKVFEVTQVYKPGSVSPDIEEEKLPIMERNVCGAIVSEDAVGAFREAKGILEMLARYVMCENFTFSQIEKAPYADKKAWLNIVSKGENIGSLCLLSLKTMTDAGIKRKQVAVFEFNLEKLVPLKSRDNSFTHLPQFPLTHKDLSLIIDENRPWSEIEKIVSPMVNELNFVEEYKGKQIPDGKKSITLSLSFGSETGTLKNEEIENKMSSIIKKLMDELGAEVRGI